MQSEQSPPDAFSERHSLYLERIKGFNPWTLEVEGIKVRFFDVERSFAAELVVEGEIEAVLALAGTLAERLDLDGWQLLSLASEAAAKEGASRDLLAEPAYRRELEALRVVGEDWPFGFEYDVEELWGEQLVFRQDSAVLWAQGTEIKAASAHPSRAEAQAAFRRYVASAREVEERVVDERTRVRPGRAGRPSGLAERVYA